MENIQDQVEGVGTEKPLPETEEDQELEDAGESNEEEEELP